MHRFERAHLDAYRQAVIASKSGRVLVEVLQQVSSAGAYEIGDASRKAAVPRGFDAGHERAALLLHEGLWAERTMDIKDEPRA